MVGVDRVGAALVGVAGSGTAQGQAQAGGSVATPFGGLFQSLVAQTTSLDQQAQTAVTGLLNGSGVEVHDAMIATQKADMAFELALQVRNKAVGAYQQMMQMQF
jgi:flagellar hook-basal body complex protein FliE